MITEGMPRPGTKPERGMIDFGNWVPYKIWQVDLWACPICEYSIMIGSGRQPLREHYQQDFQEMHKKWGADKFQVNDC